MKLSAASWGGWLLETEGALIGYDGENLSYTLEIDTAADVTGYTMYADLEYQDGTKGTLPLVKQNGTLRATVGAGYLIPGWAKIQLRGVGTASGTDAPPVKKSSMSRVRIGPSVNASETLPAPDQAAWDTYAAQMAALRDQAQKAAESVPEIEKKIGDLDKLTTTAKSTLVAAINEVRQSGGGGGSAVLYTAQELTAAQQKQARENIDVAGYNVINCLWPTEHSGLEDTDITTLLDSDVYMGIVRNSTAFPSPGLVMLQGPMAGNVYTAVLLAKDGLTYIASFQYVRSTKHFEVQIPVAAASSKLISVKLTPSESDVNVYTADRHVNEIKGALQAGHMALAYTPDAAGQQNSVGLITSCVSNFVTVLDCWDTGLASTRWHVDVDGRTWTETAYAEYAESGQVAELESAMPHPVGKTDAMTQAVGMDGTGKLWTQPGASGGSAETWELIASGEMSEAATLTVNKDANGNAFSLKSCTILVTGALSGGSGSYVRFAVTASGATYFVEASLAKENMNTDAKFIFRQGDVPTLTICSKPGTAWQSGTCTVQMALRESDNALAAAQGAVSSLRIGPWSGSAKLGVGCKYALWGVRA